MKRFSFTTAGDWDCVAAVELLPLAHSSFSSLVHSLLPKDNLFKKIFDFTSADDLDCVAAEERLHALHYSDDFIFVSFEIMCFIEEL